MDGSAVVESLGWVGAGAILEELFNAVATNLDIMHNNEAEGVELSKE